MSPEEFEVYERYESAVERRKVMSTRLSEFIDQDAMELHGLTAPEVINLLRHELRDFPVFEL